MNGADPQKAMNPSIILFENQIHFGIWPYKSEYFYWKKKFCLILLRQFAKLVVLQTIIELCAFYFSSQAQQVSLSSYCNL